tara:strand:+ start:86 stop:2002 length:1917 start_codon:yes stop_codon:yes gene_type:complete
MTNNIIIVFVSFILLVSGCQKKNKQYSNLDMFPKDHHSFADPIKAVINNLELDLEVNFERSILIGTAKITFQCNGADTIKLDSYDLNIKNISEFKSENNLESLDFDLGLKNPTLGSELTIYPKKQITGDYTIIINYETSPAAKALQWLNPEQTNGKTKPFLFTQSQAILARTWIPLQDSPGIRFTYKAKIKAPIGMMALMSASNPTKLSPDGIYEFEMNQPIPSYLMALAVGDISFQATGPRTGVYSEPEILSSASWEFGETENMIQAAEKLYGPYEWERYDLLVLPASFPFGGMENPRLTFLTPTVITGDRSLVALIAHELAHSWSGNLVTNGSWNDFWLNEGFTVYFENRIMESVYGKDYSDMLRKLSYSDLISEVDELMVNRPNDTKLSIDLIGRNPDDGVTAIAYDKGFHFLLVVESLVGRKNFDEFLKAYFKSYKFQSITTTEFIKYLRTNLLDDYQWESADLENWIYGVGLPDNCPLVSPKKFLAVESSVNLFLNNGKTPDSTSTWSTQEWLHFLQILGENKISKTELSILDNQFKFTTTNNAEILSSWFIIAIPANYQNDNFNIKVREFLTKVGRRKFLTPIYKALLDAKQEVFAEGIYTVAREGYHAVAQETLDDLFENVVLSKEAKESD